MKVLKGFTAAQEAFRLRGLPEANQAIKDSVSDIIEAVKTQGDQALRDLTERHDGVRLSDFKVPQADYHQARQRVSADLHSAINLAADRVRNFYEQQPKGGFVQQQDGSLCGQLVRPLDSVMCYVPAGDAPLFSTLIMTAVVAQVAGVPNIYIATPPTADGSVAAETLVTAEAVGLHEVYRLGGAQAIAAFAFGTKSIPKVDKIVGPGSLFTVLAKQAVFGSVGIESLPGPTETLILADDSASPSHVIADLLAQAEHDMAQPVLVTTSQSLLDKVQSQLDAAVTSLSTRDKVRDSLTNRGYCVLVEDLQEALDVANFYAPEHLCLLIQDPWQVVGQVRHAGGIFIGEHSMEALGDYIIGPSHVMPTGGTARFSSAINLRDFQKVIPFVSMHPTVIQDIGPPAALMARAEGLEAHARAIEARLILD